MDGAPDASIVFFRETGPVAFIASPTSRASLFRDGELINSRSDGPSGTALDSDSARCTNRRVLATAIRPTSVLAGVLPIRHAFDDDYSNVGNRLVFSPDRPSSRIGCDQGTRAEPFQSTVRQRDAKAARMEPSLFRSLRVRGDSLAIDGIDTGDHDPC